jgi:hypothetical protein
MRYWNQTRTVCSRKLRTSCTLLQEVVNNERLRLPSVLSPAVSAVTRAAADPFT